MTFSEILESMRVSAATLPPGRLLIYAYRPTGWWDRVRMRRKLWAAAVWLGFEVESMGWGSHGHFVIVAHRRPEFYHQHRCPACTAVRGCALDACLADTTNKFREFCADCLRRSADGELVPVLIPDVRIDWRPRP